MPENEDAEKLCGLLVAAAEKLAGVEGLVSSPYNSGTDIAKVILECRNAIQQGTITLSQKGELLRIFAPTSDWDDLVGDVELGNEVLSVLERLYRKQIE